jgi:hypothetical protein
MVNGLGNQNNTRYEEPAVISYRIKHRAYQLAEDDWAERCETGCRRPKGLGKILQPKRWHLFLPEEFHLGFLAGILEADPHT